MPVTKPLLLLNHLVAIAADKPKPKMPEATPKQMPMLIYRCHFSDTKTVETNPSVAKEQDIITIFGIPNLKINAPPNGAIDAKTKNITPMLDVMSDIFHP